MNAPRSTLTLHAAGAVPADRAGLNVLTLANDADVAALAASGALAGVQRIELQFRSSPTGAPTRRPCCCAGAIATRASCVPPATC